MGTVKLKLLVVCIVLGLFGGLVVSPAEAVTILYQRSGVNPGVSIYLGESFNSLEFENPPPAPGGFVVGKHVKGYRVLDWRDADYSKPGYPLRGDWSRCGSLAGTVDGNVNEVWMRQSGQAIQTTTRVPSTAVSIHLTGDNNDGKAEVRVDNILVATLDMGTRGNSQRALIIVRYLQNVVHTIRVDDVGVGPKGLGTDVATMGACALAFHKYFPHFWYLDCRLRLMPTPMDPVDHITAIPVTVPNGWWGGWWWWHHQCCWFRPWYGPIWRYSPYYPWPYWRYRLHWDYWPYYRYYNPWWNHWKWHGGPWFWGFKKCFHYTWRPWWPYNPWPYVLYPWKPPIIYMWSWYWDPGGKGNCVEMYTMANEDDPAGGRILPVTENVMNGLTVTEHNFNVNNKIDGDFNDLEWVEIGDSNGDQLRASFASMTGAEPNDVNDFMESEIVQELLKNNTEGGGGGRVGLQYATWTHTDAIPALEVTADSVVLNEAGEAYEYTVVPTGTPTDANVCVIPSSARLDLGNGAGEPRILKFNTGNWETPQTVTVTAVSDSYSQGTETLFIGHTISTDPNTGVSVQVTLQDDDLGGWGFNEGDINQDGKADLKDFAQFASDYLQCTDPNQP